MNTDPSDEQDAFRGLDPHSPVRVYRRQLPHWRQDRVLYFVTFRLADSIPRHVLEGWAEERRTWLAAHGLSEAMSGAAWQERYATIPEAVRRAFQRDRARKSLVELDRCHGACLLRNPETAQIVADALQFHDGRRLRCGDYVVMPNHVHWLVLPLPTHELESIMQSVKRFTATRINRHVGRTGTLWQKESYDHIVRDLKELERIRLYIEENPAKARLKPAEYICCRADWL